MTSTSSAEGHPRRGAWLATGLGLAMLMLSGRAMTSEVAPALVTSASAVFAAVMTVVLLSVGRHHPHARFGAANHVTTARAVLTSLVAGVMFVAPRASLAWWAVAFTSLAIVLDGVDGRLARRTRLESAFGARFDTEIDALLILALSVLVWRYGKAGTWVLACGAMRYAFVAGGWVWPWLAGPLRPTPRGKTVAVLQFVGLAVALVPPVMPPVSTWMTAGTLAALTWSFALDVARLRRGHG